MRDWVARNFGEHIRLNMVKVGDPVERVEFRVTTAARKSADSAARRPARTLAMRAGEEGPLPGAPLDARFTFEIPAWSPSADA